MYAEIPTGLTDEQQAICTEGHRFGADVLRPASLELDLLTPEEVTDRGSALWKVFGAWYGLGNHTAALPACYGGLELDPATQHGLFVEMGWAAADLAISLGVSSMPFQLAAQVARLTGNDQLVDEMIRPFVEDREARYVGCWAITEPGHGSDTLGVGRAEFHQPEGAGTCRARRDGGDFVVSGQKSAWVSNGSIATHALLFCTLDEHRGMAGGVVLMVPLDLPGVRRGAPLDKHGQRALNQGEIFFDQVRVPGYCLLADPDLYPLALEMTLSHANTGMSAVFTGLARAAFEEALTYARERIQGGKPIAEHQLVQSKLFAMFARYQQARALSRSVMVGLSELEGVGGLAHAISAKVTCTDTAYALASDAVQVHGGSGLVRGMLVEKLLRDARASLIEDGVNDFLGLVAARQLVDSYAC
jgi:alkylation response protein AidB-like acyl-CoA dehydrogenase